MSIRFYCPQGHRLKVPDEKAGKSARCPVCQQRVVVPLESPAESDARQVPLAVDHAAAKPAPATAAMIEPPPAIAPPPVQFQEAGPRAAGSPLAAPPTGAMVPSLVAESSAVPALGPPVEAAPTRRPWWAPFDPGLPRKAYCLADPGKRHLVRWTALAVLLLAGFQAAPAARFFNLLYAPDWAKWVVVLAVLQVAFAAYLAILPSWPSLWATMILLGGLAAVYAAAMAIVAATPAGRPLLFELDDWRRTAAPWAACNVLLLGLLAYACGRAATRWQRSWQLAYAHRND